MALELLQALRTWGAHSLWGTSSTQPRNDSYSLSVNPAKKAPTTNLVLAAPCPQFEPVKFFVPPPVVNFTRAFGPGVAVSTHQGDREYHEDRHFYEDVEI